MTMMRGFTDNARYTKSRLFIRNRNVNGAELICCDRGESTARRNPFDGLLMMTQEMAQKPCGDIRLWRKRCKTSTDANFTVGDVYHPHGGADTNQNVAWFRHFRRRVRLDRRTSEFYVAEVNLPLMELDPSCSFRESPVGDCPMFNSASSSSRMVNLQCLQNARYTKLGVAVGKVQFCIGKITKTKEFFNSTMLFVHRMSHIFFEKVIKKFSREFVTINAFNHIHTLICIKLSVVVGNIGSAISGNQYTFTIESPRIDMRNLPSTGEKRILPIWFGRIRIKPSSTDLNVITKAMCF